MDSFFIIVISLVVGGAIGWHSHIAEAEKELKTTLSKMRHSQLCKLDEALITNTFSSFRQTFGVGGMCLLDYPELRPEVPVAITLDGLIELVVGTYDPDEGGWTEEGHEEHEEYKKKFKEDYLRKLFDN